MSTLDALILVEIYDRITVRPTEKKMTTLISRNTQFLHKTELCTWYPQMRVSALLATRRSNGQTAIVSPATRTIGTTSSKKLLALGCLAR